MPVPTAPAARRPHGYATSLLRPAHAAGAIDWRLPNVRLAEAWGVSRSAIVQQRAEAGAGPAWWGGIPRAKLPPEGRAADRRQRAVAARWRAGRAPQPGGWLTETPGSRPCPQARPAATSSRRSSVGRTVPA